MSSNNEGNNNFSDLVIVSIWIIITFISIIVIPENIYIRIILAIPVVLFIPGYVLMAALFPRRDGLDITERIVLSFGLSIVIIPLLGLLLNFTFGINLVSMFVILCTYTVIFILITVYRRKRLSEDVQFTVQPNRIYHVINGLKQKNSLDIILTTILIFVMVLAVGTIYHTIIAPKIGERFTEFYVLDSPRGIYSTDLKLNSSTNWSVYVTNHEYTYINYTLRVILGNNTLVSRKLTLDHNQRWEDNISVVANKEGYDQKFEFLLFKENNFTVPYRSVHLWINVG